MPNFMNNIKTSVLRGKDENLKDRAPMLYDVLLKEKQFKIKCSCISFALEQKHTQDKLPILCAAFLFVV